MRIAAPLIVGAGPAGCTAAIALARAGAEPLLIDRDEVVGDPLCGGFMSWRTTAQLRDLGVELDDLGGHRVTRLRVLHRDSEATTNLPKPALALSRHALDTRLREVALAAGARLEFDTIRGLSPGAAQGQAHERRADAILLAAGKHDVRGQSRPRHADDPALGLRMRLPPTPLRQTLIDGAIELHLFEGGYGGIVLQEDGSANVCLALRKSALASHGGDPASLFTALADSHPGFAARLGDDWQGTRIETIGAVPYGWIAQDTAPGLFRLGDQAAVIPSLAGEGISMAIASGALAARYVLKGGPAAAPDYQRAYAASARRPVAVAKSLRALAESPLGAPLAIAATRLAPPLVRALASLSRIEPPPLPCAVARPC